MNHRSYLLLLFQFLLYLNCNGQQLWTLIVTDNDTIGLPGANVAIYSDHDTLYGSTNIQGHLEVVIDCNTMVLEVSFLGFKSITQKINPCRESRGNIFLEEDRTILDEVVIQERRKRIKIEGNNTTMDVGGSRILGNNAAEILRNSPGIVIRQDDVSLAGKPVKVLLNNREVSWNAEQLMAFLKSKSATHIQSIDLINDAGAASSADFDGAIININTIALIDGYSIQLNNSHTLRSGKLSNDIGGNIEIQKGGWTISGDGYYSRSRWDEVGVTTRNLRGDRFVENNVSHVGGNGVNGTISAFYQFNKEWTTGGSLSSNCYGSFGDLEGTSFVDAITGKDSTVIIQTNSGSERLTQQIKYNISYREDGTNTAISLDIDYSALENDSDLDQFLMTEVSDYEAIQVNESNNHILGIKLDGQAYWGKHLFQGGLHFTSVDIDQMLSESGRSFILDGNQRALFHYDEDIVASYAQLSGDYFLRYKIGLRAERTFYSAQEISLPESPSQSYNQLFPNVQLSKKINKSQLAFSYSLSIRRPRFRKLIPYRRYTSAFHYYTGNPGLVAYLPASYSFSWRYDNSWTFRIGYNRADDRILEYDRPVSGTNLTEGVTENNGSSRSLNFTLSYAKAFTSSLRANASVHFSRGKQTALDRSGELLSDTEYNAFSSYGSLSIKINSSLTFNPNYYYSSDVFYGIVQNLSFGYLGFSLSHTLGKTGFISLSARDLLLTGITRSVIDYGDILEHSENNWGSRQVILQFSYGFQNESEKIKKYSIKPAGRSVIRRF